MLFSCYMFFNQFALSPLTAIRQLINLTPKKGNQKISQSQTRIHHEWSVSEGDICEWLLGYILVIFVAICVY